MEFALSSSQAMLQRSVAGVLSEASTLEKVRQHANGCADASLAISSAVDALGLSGILVPEAAGGLELGLLDAALVQEALGAALAPTPFMAHSVMAPVALSAVSEVSPAPEAAELLNAMGTGRAKVAVTSMEWTGAREGAGFTIDGPVASGKALFVLGMEDATHILCKAQDGALTLVACGQEHVEARPLTSIDRTRSFSEVTLSSAPVVRLADPEPSSVAMARAVAAGRVMIAADTLGAAQTMLDKAVDYAQERKQFGRTIGSFQAVKHMCAEMAAALEPCRALVWHTAYALDEGNEEGLMMACLAKAHLAEVGTFVAKTATEVHGGMGFTDLLGLHYWFKRIGANRQLLGGPERVRDEAARLQGWVN